MSLQDTTVFWSTVAVFIQFDYLQLDMKNIDQPLQKLRKPLLLNTEFDTQQKLDIELSLNEFYENDDQFGFLNGEIEAKEYLTIQQMLDITGENTKAQRKYNATAFGYTNLPQVEV